MKKVLFGHNLTKEEIQKVCESGDVYQKICEGSKTFSMQVMTPMIEELKKEILRKC